MISYGPTSRKDPGWNCRGLGNRQVVGGLQIDALLRLEPAPHDIEVVIPLVRAGSHGDRPTGGNRRTTMLLGRSAVAAEGCGNFFSRCSDVDLVSRLERDIRPTADRRAGDEDVVAGADGLRNTVNDLALLLALFPRLHEPSPALRVTSVLTKLTEPSCVVIVTRLSGSQWKSNAVSTSANWPRLCEGQRHPRRASAFRCHEPTEMAVVAAPMVKRPSMR